MAKRRPVIQVQPDVLSFTVIGPEDAAVNHAQQVIVSVTNPNGVDQQTVHVVATAGSMVSCAAPGIDDKLPEMSTFVQDCELTYVLDQTRNHAIWVLPYDLSAPTVSTGTVFVRIGEGTTTAEAPVVLSISTPEQHPSAGPSGAYKGTLSLAGASLAYGTDASSFQSVAAQPPPWPINIPVEVWRADEAGDVALIVFDQSQTLTVTGQLLIVFPGGEGTTATPTITGTPRWYSNDANQSVDNATGAVETLTGVVGPAFSTDDEATLVWDDSASTLHAMFGVAIRGATSTAPAPALVWRLELRPDSDPPRNLEWIQPQESAGSTNPNPWVLRAANMLSPARLGTDLVWYAATSGDDTVNCLNSPRAIPFVPTSTPPSSLMLERCRETVGDHYGVDCDSVTNALLANRGGLSAGFFEDRYEVCCADDPNADQTYTCQCGSTEMVNTVNATGTAGTVILSACPIERDTIDPTVVNRAAATASSERQDRYLLASTCAVRIAHLDSLDAWPDDATAPEMLQSHYGGFDSTFVDELSGDLLAWQHPAYHDFSRNWFHSWTSIYEPTLVQPALPSELPFFTDDPGISQHEMAAVCADDLLRVVPSSPLPTASAPVPPSDPVPVAVPISTTADLIVTPAFRGSTLEVRVVPDQPALWFNPGVNNHFEIWPATQGSLVTTTVEDVRILLQGNPYFLAVASTTSASDKTPVQAVPQMSLDVSTDDATNAATWSTLRTHAEDLFNTSGCIDIARFNIETDWLVAAAEIEAYWENEDTTTLLDDNLTVASRLLQRRLSQWLTIHAFVARDAAQSDKLRSVIQQDGYEDTTPVSLEDAFTVMDRGLSFVLYPEYFETLANMPPQWIAKPDYRVAASPADFAAHHEQGLGISVVLLDTLSAYLELGDRYLETIETDLYLESLTGDSHTTRDALMRRYGRMMRFILPIQALANGLHARAQEYADSVPEELSWASQWQHARAKLSATQNRVSAHMSRVLSGVNPLGLSDDDLPLYFVDPQTTNQRFFASSDYLLQTWAVPAVARADTRLDAARQAQLSKQDSELRQLLTEQDHHRRTRDLTLHYGGALRTACGLSDSAEDVFAQYLEGSIDIGTCQYVPASEDPSCKEQYEKIWESTSSQDLLNMLSTCGPEAMSEASRNIYDARRKLCTLIRVAADSRRTDLNSHINKTRLNPFAYWDYATPPNPSEEIDKIRSGDMGNYDSIEQIRTYLEHYAQYQGEDFSSYIEARIDWPVMDSTNISGCGTDFDLPEDLHDTNIDEINTWFSRVSKALAWNSDAGTYCTVSNGPHDCAGYTTEEALLRRFAPHCDTYLASHPFPDQLMSAADLEDAFFDPEALAKCYRGTLADFELAVLAARQQLRESLASLIQIQSSYDTTARSCIQIAQLNDNLAAAMDAHYKATQGIADASKGVRIGMDLLNGAVDAFTEDPLGAITNATDIVNTLLGDKQAEVDHQFEVVGEQIRASKEALQCWTQADQVIGGFRTQVEAVRSALLNVTQAHVHRQNQLVELAAQLREGEAVLGDEDELFSELPDQRHNYWYDEKEARFESDFQWAKRLTYLAMLAAEYELQQSFDLRELILEAAHPMELEEAIRQIEQQQATRGINGRRPESKSFVRSLRDDILKLRNTSTVDNTALAGDRKLAAVDRWVAMLRDTGSSVFSNDGSYLGQGIRFNLSPDDALHYRCAERMWSVSAAIQGDLLGVIEPQLPVFLLKRNTFSSQWCDGRGPDGEQFQTGTIRPSVNLFVGSDSAGESNETEAYSWGFIDAWINTKRKDFYSEHYTEGASDELAGRGLYGDYMLLIPYKGFIDKGVPLDRIEDVLLKFDYVSVDNGGSLGSPPPGYDEHPFDPGIVHDLQAHFGCDSNAPPVCNITLTWKPSEAPVATGTYVVRRDDGVETTVQTETFVDDSVTLCNEHTYTVSVVDTYGDTLPPQENVVVGAANCWDIDTYFDGDGTADFQANGALAGIDDNGTVWSAVAVLELPTTLRYWVSGARSDSHRLFFTYLNSGFQSVTRLEVEGTLYPAPPAALTGNSGSFSCASIIDRSAPRVGSRVARQGDSAETYTSTPAGATPTYMATLTIGSAAIPDSAYNGKIYAVAIIAADPTTPELRRLTAGEAPWSIWPGMVKRAYTMSDNYVNGSDIYVRDVASEHGSGLAPIDAKLQNGDGSRFVTP